MLEPGEVIKCWPTLDLPGRRQRPRAAPCTTGQQHAATDEQRERAGRGPRTCLGGFGRLGSNDRNGAGSRGRAWLGACSGAS